MSYKAGISRNVLIVLAAAALVMLTGLHLFLFRVLMKNQERLQDEFSFRERQLTEAKEVEFSMTAALQEIDREKFTIRINTWKRVEQLLVSLEHHSKCDGVAQIQVIWCTDQGDPPQELQEFPKVVIEVHETNSLNERFHILKRPPTIGILSIDDDVLRPCEAIDAGFFQWVQHPERMVGFDARSYSVDQEGKWSYAYLSTTEKTNKYALTLPRYSFLHRDYLDGYMNDMPKPILERVAQNFNCEDIAMSFYVSSKTGGQPPLLADYWAIKSMMKLYSEAKISGQSDHKSLRDACVDDFATMLNLKGQLKRAKFVRGSYFECGAKAADNSKAPPFSKSQRQLVHEELTKTWRGYSNDHLSKELQRLQSESIVLAYRQGLIEKSEPWKKRWKTRR